MKELKFKEVDKRYNVSIDESELRIKPFYTLSDKESIYYDMSSKTDSLNRDFSLIVLTAKLCTNIDFEGMTDNEVYDVVAELRLITEFQMEVDEYTHMHELINRDKSAYNAIVQIIDVIDKKMDGFDATKIQEELAKLGGDLKDVKGNK